MLGLVQQILVQNRRYGWNANSTVIYKADIVSKHDLYAGDSVTQRTDFKAVIIEANADIRFTACNTIHLKPGFHAMAGSIFHAKINTENCFYCNYSGLAPVPTHTTRDYESLELQGADNFPSNETNPVVVFPNPGAKQVNLKIVDNQTQQFEYRIYDAMGKLIIQDNVLGSNTQLSLESGIYIVKVKLNESWYVKKLIMQ